MQQWWSLFQLTIFEEAFLGHDSFGGFIGLIGSCRPHFALLPLQPCELFTEESSSSSCRPGNRLRGKQQAACPLRKQGSWIWRYSVVGNIGQRGTSEYSLWLEVVLKFSLNLYWSQALFMAFQSSLIFWGTCISQNARLAFPKPSYCGARELAHGRCSGDPSSWHSLSMLFPPSSGLWGPQGHTGLHFSTAGLRCQMPNARMCFSSSDSSGSSRRSMGAYGNNSFTCFLAGSEVRLTIHGCFAWYQCALTCFSARIYWLWASSFCANLCYSACWLSELNSQSKTLLYLLIHQASSGMEEPARIMARQAEPSFTHGQEETRPTER